MNPRPTPNLDYSSPTPANFGHKLRPASHTYEHGENALAWTLLTVGLAGLIVIAKIWLIQLLG